MQSLFKNEAEVKQLQQIAKTMKQKEFTKYMVEVYLPHRSKEWAKSDNSQQPK
jgi:hypothetical protein